MFKRGVFQFAVWVLMLSLSGGVCHAGVTYKNLGVHPNLFLNQAEINELQAALASSTGPQYLKDAYQRILNNALPTSQAVYDYAAAIDSNCQAQGAAPGSACYTPRLLYSNSYCYSVDDSLRRPCEFAAGTRMMNSAIVYAITGQTGYASAVRTILLSWSNPVSGSTLGGGLSHGMADVGLIGFAGAYDLIYNSGVLSATDKSQIESWFRNVAAPIVSAPWYPSMGGPNWYKNALTAADVPTHSTYGKNHYHNELMGVNALYASVGFVTGDVTRIRWALEGLWDYQYYNPPTDGSSPRSLREFISNGIYRSSTYTATQHTDAYSGANRAGTQVVPDYYGNLIPNGSMFDYWGRGPKPCPWLKADGSAYGAWACPDSTVPDEGLGQSYQGLTLDYMLLTAHMAWHYGDNLFLWQAPNGNRLKDGADFMRQFAFTYNYPQWHRSDGSPYFHSGTYEYIYSYYRDPAAAAVLQQAGAQRIAGSGGDFANAVLLGYANRSSTSLTLQSSTQSSLQSSGTYLSDLTWVSSINGWGPVEKDTSNGENAAGDGRTITLNGTTYAKGLGVHAASEVVYNLGGKYTSFISDLGVDDEVTSGSVIFQVWADGVKLYDSGIMTGSTATKAVALDITAKQQLKLVVTDAGNGNAYDHADWAGARIVAASSSTTDTTPPVRANGSPTGTLPAGTTQVTLSLTTNEDATCKYGTVAGTSYASLPYLFTTTGGMSHSVLLSGLSAGSRTYDVRCADKASPANVNTTDYAISFTISTSSTTTYLSDLAWVSATNGWGPVEKDTSNGENAAGDGRTITLNGVPYTKGLGVHANSEVVYALGGKYTSFLSDIGVDDEVATGSVIFQVWADGVKLYDSGIMTGSTATKAVALDITAKQQLKLVVTDAGNGNAYDHADWAGARLK